MPLLTTRRAFLLTLPAGLLAAAYHAGPSIFSDKLRTSRDTHALDEFLKPTQRTPKERDYAKFLSTLELRYITPKEILSAHRRVRNGIQNELPPPQLWHNLVPTLKIADEMRQLLGVPLRQIVSAYRSPDYNAQCPGASRYSQHIKNQALDLIFDCRPEHAAEVAENLREEGLFRGGIGRYKTFVHIDTRGRNANW